MGMDWMKTGRISWRRGMRDSVKQTNKQKRYQKESRNWCAGNEASRAYITISFEMETNVDVARCTV